ncbi:MAG: LysM peptidoglycan-binding domain-containing protein [Pseudomonas sp.]|uniref:LysM peptidoglycan-binding domain-containing protein n=1 Tax=Pseudomonas sp. TaxID=306 RepID=UPI0030F200D1
MSSIAQKYRNIDTLARLARVLLVVSVAVLAGCQSTASHSPSPSNNVTLSSRTQPPEWMTDTSGSDKPQDIWDRMRSGFKLQDEIGINPRIEQQRLWFASKPAYLESASGRGSLYIHYVVERLEANNMPLELALLPVIESSYNPFALSRSDAVGLWQFIPSTGRNFNLQQTTWYDGRRDITASTNAAIEYLSRLHEMFNGDWLLALAAYNAGEGTVSRAIERNEKLGLPTDYWNLPLPKETQDYVPKLLALSQLVNAPAAYGINLNPIANQPYFEVVEFDKPMDLTRVAAMADMDRDELIQLNPAFKRQITRGGPSHLLVPAQKAQRLTATLAQIQPSDITDFQEYRVRKGDSLHGIASRYKLSADELKEANAISGNNLSVGQTLTIPVSAGSKPAPSPFPESNGKSIAVASSTTTSIKLKSYKVKGGDNLWQIAKANKLDVADLRRWNNLPDNSVKPGQTLALQGTQQVIRSIAKNSPAQGRETVTYYKVQKGDSMYMIAKRFNVEMQNLKSWNPKTSHDLTPGQTITLYLTDR